MSINFDGKGNIEATTNDGVIAVKLYSLEKTIEQKDKEIERLNNIVNQVEKLAESEYEKYKDKSDVSLNCVALANLKILNKLKELKGSSNNE